jgi:hypothetical protein
VRRVRGFYAGRPVGTATAALLFGDANPSGKLPVTFPRSLADVPAYTTAQWPGANNQVQSSGTGLMFAATVRGTTTATVTGRHSNGATGCVSFVWTVT